MPLIHENSRAEAVSYRYVDRATYVDRETIDDHIRRGRALQAQMIASLFKRGFRALLNLVTPANESDSLSGEGLARPGPNRS